MEVYMILLFSYLLIAGLVFVSVGYRSKYRDLKKKSNVLITESRQNNITHDAFEIENKKLRSEIEIVSAQFSSYRGAIAYVNRSYEELTMKYIFQRIELFQFQYPNYDGPSELLYKLDDLRKANTDGKINSIDYLNEIDKIFNKIDHNDYVIKTS